MNLAGVFALSVCGWLTFASSAMAAPPKLPQAAPETVRMSSARLRLIDYEVGREIAAKRLPGCVVLVARQGRIVWSKAYGNRQLEPAPVAMTVDTVFDLASLTKPLVTATSVLLLVEQGKLQLRDTVAQYLPEFGQNGKDKITILQLLTHQGGLIADNPIGDYSDGSARAMERIFASSPQAGPGTKFVYSDVGFIVLGALVERVSGKSLHEFSQENLFAPLGMAETGYVPDESLRSRAAPTQKRGEQWMKGEVHDPRAWALGGIAGHAGLFSTAADLTIFAEMLLNRGIYADVRVLAPRTVDVMTQPVAVSSGWRALGWDVQTGYSTNKGELMTASAYGHGGFTGTGLWIDPELDLFVIFLSNRVHPDGTGLVNPLIGRVGSIAAAAVEDAPRNLERLRTVVTPER